jgi:hypothetical protein
MAAIALWACLYIGVAVVGLLTDEWGAALGTGVGMTLGTFGWWLLWRRFGQDKAGWSV